MERSLLLVIVALAVAGLAVAQDQPVLLQYKFVPGETGTYVTKATGTMPVSINPGPETGIPAMTFDTTVDVSLTMQTTCKSVNPDGSGLVESRIPAMVIRMAIAVGDQPMDIVMDWANGKLSSVVNGQEQPLDQNGQKLATALGSVMRYTVKPTGEQTPDAETVKLLNDMYNASAFTGIDMSKLSALTSRLPAEPVAPGATWKVEDDQTNAQGGMSGKSEMKFVGFEDIEGVRLARIEGQATMSMSGQSSGMTGPGGMNFNLTKLEANISFVNHFDPVKGVHPLSQANMAQNMIMVVSMPGMGGGNAINLPVTIENAQMTMEARKQ